MRARRAAIRRARAQAEARLAPGSTRHGPAGDADAGAVARWRPPTALPQRRAGRLAGARRAGDERRAARWPSAAASSWPASGRARRRPRRCRCRATPACWRVLLRNLLDNAVRYAPRAARVTLRFEPRRGCAVENDGPPLSPRAAGAPGRALPPRRRPGR
ncbi:MAG: hypothetical protein MZW92_55470 [Comamonadaceae bacterium]|nr:hypothetical protein [Comamonadaceae bacterium]